MLIAALLVLLSSGVEIRAEPAALRLDRERTAQLRFVAPPGPLSVECSAGTLEQLRETAPGQWRAQWRAPKSLVPRVALIVARRGETVGFAALPLSGGGDAEVRTRPGAVVSVSIGPETFGPLRAGADGTAVVPVVVPPGVDFAQQGGRLIDLHVPRTRTVQLAPLDRELAADRDQEIEIAVAAVSRAGEPLEDAPLQWTTSRGELTRAEAVAPGLYRVRWRIPRGSAGEIFVRASVPGDPSPSEAVVRLVPGAIASIELKALQATAVAGGNAVELSALAVDAAGNPADGPVEFFATGGALTSGAAGTGRHRLLLTPPAMADEDAEMEVTAAAGGDGQGPRAGIRIPLLPAAGAEDGGRGPKVVARSAVAIRTGVLADGRGLVAPLLGVEGGLRRRWRSFQVSLLFDLWWARASQSTDAAPAPVDTRDDFLVASVSAALRMPLSDRAAGWARAGMALVAASARVRVGGQGEATSRGTVPGVELGLGAERRMWGGVPFLEVRLLRTGSFALPNLTGALTGFTFCAGYRLEMP